MPFKFGTRSKRNLAEVHPDLQRLCQRALALSPVDFGIVDGVRTTAEQKRNLAKGVSQTLRSRHLTGHAIDFAVVKNGNLDFYDIPLFRKVMDAFSKASKELGIPIVRGGDWKTLKDFGHIELTRAKYPA